jgi:hypothetical protein
MLEELRLFIEHGGDSVLHIADHIAIAVLIACMLSAGAMALYKAR